jgi:hypothetical protein
MSDLRVPRPSLRDDFRKRLRADLMNEAVALAEERRSRRAGIGARVAGWLGGPRVRAAIVVAAAFVFLLGGTGVAAAGSLPGDITFPLKRAAEQIELALAADDSAKVEVLARQAERRLEELGRSASRADRAPTASSEYEAAVQRLTAAVAALRAAEPSERREAAQQVAEAAREKHTIVLEELKDRLPADAKKGVERALEDHRKQQAPADRERRPADQQQGPARSPDPQRGGRPSGVPARP